MARAGKYKPSRPPHWHNASHFGAAEYHGPLPRLRGDHCRGPSPHPGCSLPCSGVGASRQGAGIPSPESRRPPRPRVPPMLIAARDGGGLVDESPALVIVIDGRRRGYRARAPRHGWRSSSWSWSSCFGIVIGPQGSRHRADRTPTVRCSATWGWDAVSSPDTNRLRPDQGPALELTSLVGFSLASRRDRGALAAADHPLLPLPGLGEWQPPRSAR